MQIEALACESVVVTSDIAPLNEYMADGKNALLVESFEDGKVIADAIRRACTDMDLRNTLKTHARESVRRFEKPVIEKQEAHYYQKVLDMKAAGEFDHALGRFLRNSQQFFLRQEK